jgi:general secretion pathway protein M
MISRLSRGQSRFLAATMLLVLVALVVGAIAIPAWSMNRHYDELISGMSDQLAIYKRVATHSGEYQAEYQRLVRLQQQDKRYLQGATESLATAELQRTVKQVVAGRKGDIISTQVVPTTEEEGFKRVAIRTRMKSTLEDMVTIFHTLESSKPYLFIDDVTIRSRPVSRRRLPAYKELDQTLRILDIDFRLSGYMRSEKR